MKKLFLLFGLALTMLLTTSCGTIYQKIKYSNKSIEISNPCQGEEMDFKLISLIGDKEEQTMVLNCRLINRGVNKDVRVGGNFVAYDTEGVGHNGISGFNITAKTDKKVDFHINIPGKVVPRKVKKMAAITFDIDDCHIEMKNVPIMWKKIEKENK
ncbi:MAG: hypothetical protein IJK92_08235 [Bacteroidales bacterium]|nr:hypothetical protein [Bacteroidales bacterium]